MGVWVGDGRHGARRGGRDRAAARPERAPSVRDQWRLRVSGRGPGEESVGTGLQGALEEVVTVGGGPPSQHMLAEAGTGRAYRALVIGSERPPGTFTGEGLRVANGSGVGPRAPPTSSRRFGSAIRLLQKLRTARPALTAPRSSWTRRGPTLPMPDGHWPGNGIDLAEMGTPACRRAATVGKPIPAVQHRAGPVGEGRASSWAICPGHRPSGRGGGRAGTRPFCSRAAARDEAEAAKDPKTVSPRQTRWPRGARRDRAVRRRTTQALQQQGYRLPARTASPNTRRAQSATGREEAARVGADPWRQSRGPPRRLRAVDHDQTRTGAVIDVIRGHRRTRRRSSVRPRGSGLAR